MPSPSSSPTNPSSHTITLEVRDYECDQQGIVNNAVYQHYLEHARHQFLKRFGLSFAQLAQAGTNLVVTRAELDYRVPLRSGDAVRVESRIERISPVRFAFQQDIYRDGPGERRLALSAKVLCAATDRAGRPIRPDILEPMFAACGGSTPTEHRE